MCVLCRSQRLKNGSYDTSLPAIRKRVEKYRVQRVKHDLANLVAIDREVLLDLLDDALDVLERDNASESPPLGRACCGGASGNPCPAWVHHGGEAGS